MPVYGSSAQARAAFMIGQIRSQELPRILTDKKLKETHYLPDFSYAGYRNGESELPTGFKNTTIVNVVDFGVKADDGLDDSKALLKAMENAHQVDGPVLVQLPAGKIILSEILYIERDSLILTGTGSGQNGTVIFCPRPMKYLPDPPALQELRDYLAELDKHQREPENNIDLPFSQYAWAGGMIWTRKPGVRTKAYLDRYDTSPIILATLQRGKRGTMEITVASAHELKVGQVVQIEWYNKDGKDGAFLQSLYGNSDLKIGSHNWNYPEHALVHQPTMITAIKGTMVTIKDPLLHDIRPEWQSRMVQWDHLKEVGIEQLRIEFPIAPNIAHHIEEGYNGIYLTRLYNGWVKDVKIENADSGILTEEVSNITIKNIGTSGEKLAHYSVSMSGVHNVLVENLAVKNRVRHPLSFNTFSTRSVYLDCRVERDPILDQHSGANHQNLFDNIEVSISLNGDSEYPLFAGGGAGYWKPSHGAFTTFWNIEATFEDGLDLPGPILINGMTDGPNARLIGVHANKDIKVEYAPGPYIESENSSITAVPSLYRYQLKSRLK